MDAEDIFDPEIRKAVNRLQKAFPRHEYQTCYYCYVYENYSLESALRRLGSVPQKLEDISQSLCGIANEEVSASDRAISVGVLPAEIWQIVCSYLEYESLAALRLTSSALADIAAEFLIERVRIDTSFESLRRLRDISEHVGFRKNIKSLYFEGALLANVGCIHRYMEHYELDHHRADKPEPPPDGKDFERSLRLYNRNLNKWMTEITDKYKHYRKIYEAQQLLLTGPKVHLFDCIRKFPNLTHIIVKSDVQCQHALSERFKDRYGQDCAVPLSIDSTPTVWQLENILRPGTKILGARILSPTFFTSLSKQWLQSAFQDLERVNLMIGPENEFMRSVTSGTSIRLLQGGHLAQALSACRNLQSLTLDFYIPMGDSYVLTLDDLLPVNHTFDKLSFLDINNFTTTEDKFLGMLKVQPSLKCLHIAFSRLTHGDWPNAIKRMRKDLELESFYCEGYIEDADTLYGMDLCDREAWLDGVRLTLATCVDCYVTDPNHPDENEDNLPEGEHDLLYNPLKRIEFDFEEDNELSITFGPISEDSDDSDEDDSDDDDLDEDSDDEDTDMESTTSSDASLADTMDID